MIKRTLPGTDLDLSVVGMGCWPLGGEHWGATDQQAQARAVRAALHVGINWFDTAPLYGAGQADRALAKALGADIHRVMIATKVGARADGLSPEGNDGHAHSDLRPEHIVADCEASLRRLREPLDLLQVHWPCEWGTPLEDSVAALQSLVDAGKIRHWGVCNYGPAQVRRLRAIGGVASLQTPYSLLRGEFEGGLLGAVSGDSPVGVLAYEPLVRGLLTDKFKGGALFGPDDMRSRDDRFRGRRFLRGRLAASDLTKIGERVGVSAASLAVGWVASRPGITAVIAGCRSPEQVRQNVAAVRMLGRSKLWEVVHKAAARHNR